VGPRAGLDLQSYSLTGKWDRVVLDKLTVARITKEGHQLLCELEGLWCSRNRTDHLAQTMITG
jgi:hypothetical protein